MLIENKVDLRSKMKTLLQNITDKQRKDMQIYDILRELSIYKNAIKVFSYISFNGEVDTHKLILDALKRKIDVFVPKIISSYVFKVVKLKNFSELKEDKFGILAPVGDDYIDIVDFDIILIPGLAFDKEMNRLGRGKGYFDRFLKDVKGVKIGLCYDFQIVEKVPIIETDVKMDIIISNTGIKGRSKFL